MMGKKLHSDAPEAFNEKLQRLNKRIPVNCFGKQQPIIYITYRG